MLARRAGSQPAPAPVQASGPRPSHRRAIAWVAASAAGTALLVAGTSHLTTRIANIPLLWVLPLGVYLLTFILWFESRLLKVRPITLGLLVAGFCASLLLLAWAEGQAAPLWLIVALLLVLASGCLLAHGWLYSLRPTEGGLTGYYFALSLGGALGGLLVGLGAPFAFNRVFEFPLAVSLCAFTGLLWVRGRQWPAGLAAAAMVPLALGLFGVGREARQPGRSFRDPYGVVTVREAAGLRLMLHGAIVHGIERQADPREPLAFFGRHSGLGQTVDLLRSRKPALKVGCVGLGLGSVAGHLQAGDHLRFYEISSLVVDLAVGRDAVFQGVNASPARIETQVGDGRRLLEAELQKGPQGFDLLLIDAFSGGQVPWHLLTLEALGTFLDHLAPDGVLLVHVSNRLALDRLLAASARGLHLWAAALDHPSPFLPAPLGPLEMDSHYIALARTSTFADPGFLRHVSWVEVPPGAAVIGPLTRPKADRGARLAASLTPWRDDRNSLAALVWAGRPGYAGWR